MLDEQVQLREAKLKGLVSCGSTRLPQWTKRPRASKLKSSERWRHMGNSPLTETESWQCKVGCSRGCHVPGLEHREWTPSPPCAPTPPTYPRFRVSTHIHKQWAIEALGWGGVVCVCEVIPAGYLQVHVHLFDIWAQASFRSPLAQDLTWVQCPGQG